MAPHIPQSVGYIVSLILCKILQLLKKGKYLKPSNSLTYSTIILFFDCQSVKEKSDGIVIGIGKMNQYI